MHSRNERQVIDLYGNVVSVENEGIDCGPINEPLNEESEPLNEYEISLISYLEEKPGANRTDIENTLDISLATLKRATNSLQKKNLIERIGSRKTGGYYLIARNKMK